VSRRARSTRDGPPRAAGSRARPELSLRRARRASLQGRAGRAHRTCGARDSACSGESRDWVCSALIGATRWWRGVSRQCETREIGGRQRETSEMIGAPTRSEIAKAAPAPVLFVRRGTRPALFAPRDNVTQFKWSMAGNVPWSDAILSITRNAVESDATFPNNASCSPTPPRSDAHSPRRRASPHARPGPLRPT
jgi:hypothetical protein